VDKDEALRILTRELESLRAMSYPALAERVGPAQILTRMGADGTEYQIEIEVFPDSPRQPHGNLRVTASIDDGTLPAAILPITRDFILGPGGAFIGE
jgi:hypothetical protein